MKFKRWNEGGKEERYDFVYPICCLAIEDLETGQSIPFVQKLAIRGVDGDPKIQVVWVFPVFSTQLTMKTYFEDLEEKTKEYIVSRNMTIRFSFIPDERIFQQLVLFCINKGIVYVAVDPGFQGYLVFRPEVPNEVQVTIREEGKSPSVFNLGLGQQISGED